MYFPCLVFPYQRLPGLWYTPDSVFTQTMPAGMAGEADFCAVAGFEADVAAFVGFESEDTGDGKDGVAEELPAGGVLFLFFSAFWLF